MPPQDSEHQEPESLNVLLAIFGARMVALGKGAHRLSNSRR